jgi:hypothetical protein
MSILLHLLLHHLALVVSVSSVLGLLILASGLLSEEFFVVRAQELIHILARFTARIKVAITLVRDILVDFVALVGVFGVLTFNSHLLHLITQLFVTIVVFFALTDAVSKL